MEQTQGIRYQSLKPPDRSIKDLLDSGFAERSETATDFFASWKISLPTTLVMLTNFCLIMYGFLFITPSTPKCVNCASLFVAVTTFLVLAGVVLKQGYSQFAQVLAITHNLSEVMLAVFAISNRELQHHPVAFFLVAALWFAWQVFFIVHRPIEEQVKLTILIGDIVHYPVIILLFISAILYESHYWFLVLAMVMHHTYDILSYLWMWKVNCPQWMAVVLNSISSGIIVYCCWMSE